MELNTNFKNVLTPIIALILLTVLFASAVPVAGNASDTTMFRANPEHTGIYDNGGIEPNNQKIWSFTIGSSVFSSPAVANGVVYVGSFDHKVYAINATTGLTQWSQQFTTGGQVRSSPAVANGVVFIGSDDTKVYAIGNQPIVVSTTLTATAVPTTVTIHQPFTISGTLNTTDAIPIEGATIQLQKNVNGAWQAVPGKTTTTTPTGTYTISTSESTANAYQYRTAYAGDATHAGTNSTSVTVKVVSKASVQRDFTTLKTTLTKLPSSAFIPGTKVAALSVIGAAELNFKVGSYGAAATTLEKTVLPQMDGCAKTGKPDVNDWVRTCAAQNQLYRRC